MYSMFIFVSLFMIGGIFLQQMNYLPQNSAVLVLIISVPFVIGIAVLFYIALNPKGPEADFVLPAIETDINDCSVVKGVILTKDKQKIAVEVTVQNVYGVSTDLFDTNAANNYSSGLSNQEMFDMALEEVQKKYAECQWDAEPGIV